MTPSPQAHAILSCPPRPPPLPPDTTCATTPTPNKIKIIGIDKQKVGQFAAEVREKRPPEPYKGKGIRYAGEHIIRKEGKTGKGK